MSAAGGLEAIIMQEAETGNVTAARQIEPATLKAGRPASEH
jgi:hypothetical protein